MPFLSRLHIIMHSDDLGLVQQPEHQVVELRTPGAVAPVVQAQTDSHTGWAIVLLLASDVSPPAIVWCAPRGHAGTAAGVVGQLIHCLSCGYVVPSTSVAAVDGDGSVIVPVEVHDRRGSQRRRHTVGTKLPLPDQRQAIDWHHTLECAWHRCHQRVREHASVAPSGQVDVADIEGTPHGIQNTLRERDIVVASCPAAASVVIPALAARTTVIAACSRQCWASTCVADVLSWSNGVPTRTTTSIAHSLQVDNNHAIALCLPIIAAPDSPILAMELQSQIALATSALCWCVVCVLPG